MNAEPCPFCAVAGGRVGPAFQRLFGSGGPPEVLLRGRRFFVALDSSPLAVGHVLIVPQDHILSLLRNRILPIPQMMSVLEGVIGAVSDILGTHVCAFEHGGCDLTGSVVGCVDHAHLHIVPLSLPLSDLCQRRGLKPQVFSPLSSEQALSKEPYLFLRDPDGTAHIVVGEDIPAQLVRRAIAEELHQPVWAWRDFIDFADELGTRDRIMQGEQLLRTRLVAMGTQLLQGL